MKLTKMSLVAALLLGSSAFALDNVKMSGDANLVYQTADGASGYDAIAGKDGELFSKDSSSADVAVNLNVTADLLKNDLVSISAGAGYTVLTTLGLENNFVSNVWGGAHTATTGTGGQYGSALGGAQVNTASWFNEAWVAATAGKTTAKLGRMVLDTPLAFTETWTIEQNTFDAAVVINQDIPDTTLVGAYVGNGNGTETFGLNAHSNVTALGLASAGVVNANGDFTTYGTNGAYAAGVINNSWKPLAVQAWYYDVVSLAQAYWLQADLDASTLGVDGLIAGAQYSGVTYVKGGVANSTTADIDSSVYALMLGYEMKDMFTAKVSYSSVDKDAGAGFNTATATGTAQSKLYTEAWWNYGYVTAADTQAYNVTLEAPVEDVADFGFYYTYANQDKGTRRLTEYTLTASRSFGTLDATVALINYQTGKVNHVQPDAVNLLQVYATLNF